MTASASAARVRAFVPVKDRSPGTACSGVAAPAATAIVDAGDVSAIAGPARQPAAAVVTAAASAAPRAARGTSRTRMGLLRSWMWGPVALVASGALDVGRRASPARHHLERITRARVADKPSTETT